MTINNILPGRFDTERLRSNLAASASRRGVPLETVERAAEAAIPRVGSEGLTNSGSCAFVCSAHAAYLTAQNVLIDGGAYPGTL